jgi:hypothetical protein
VWNKADSEVQKTIQAVKKLLGTSFEVEPEWAILWNALSKHFPDPANFVPIVASIFVAWCKSFIDIAEDERNEEWTETLLEKLKLTRGVGLKVLIEVGDGKPTCDWSDKTMAFEICLPKSVVPRSHTMIAAFHDDLGRAFLPPVKEPTLPVRGATSGAKAQDDDAFTGVGSDFGGSSIMTPSTTTDHFVSQLARLDALPDVKTLERPEDLMQFPPYHMIVQHPSYGKSVTIQCSHQPSLNLISEYFMRWVKQNHNSTNKVCLFLRQLERRFRGLIFDNSHLLRQLR